MSTGILAASLWQGRAAPATETIQTRAHIFTNIYLIMVPWRSNLVLLIAIALLSTLSTGCRMDPTNRVNEMAPAGTGFIFRKQDAGRELRKYAVFIPYTYDSSKRYPTIVFLHGFGEAGDDGRSQLSVGLGRYIGAHPESFPYIAIFPQSSGEWTGDDRAEMVSEILDEVQRDYSVDPDRITLTGISTGGTGVWIIGARYADRFSALVPMCAYGDGEDVPTLTHLPIWMFHNSGDPLVLSTFSKRMYDKLRAAGANVQFTEYGTFGHDCWSRAYNDSKLWTWIADQQHQ